MGSTISYFMKNKKQIPKNKDINIDDTYNNILANFKDISDLEPIKTQTKTISEQLSKFNEHRDDNVNLFKESQENILNNYYNVSKSNIDLLKNYSYLIDGDVKILDKFRSVCDTSIGDNFADIYQQFIVLCKNYNYDYSNIEIEVKNNYSSVINVCITVLEFAKNIIKTYNENWKNILNNNDDYKYVSEHITENTNENININYNVILAIMNESNDELKIISNTTIDDKDSVIDALTKINSVFDLLYDLFDDENEMNKLLSNFKLFKQQIQIQINSESFNEEIINLLNNYNQQYITILDSYNHNNKLISEYKNVVNEIDINMSDLSLVVSEYVEDKVSEYKNSIINSLHVFNENVIEISKSNLGVLLTSVNEDLEYLNNNVSEIYNEHWLSKFNEIPINEIVDVYNNYISTFKLIDESYNSITSNLTSLITIDTKIMESLNNYKTTLINSYITTTNVYKSNIQKYQESLIKNYELVNITFYNLNENRNLTENINKNLDQLNEYLNTILNCYYDIGVKSLDDKIGFNAYFNKSFNELNTSIKNDEILKTQYYFNECENYYNKIVNSYDIFINNYKSFMILTKDISEKIKDEKLKLENEINEIKYIEETNKLTPVIESKIDTLNYVFTNINEISKTINFINNDVNNLINEKFMLINSDDVLKAVNDYYKYKSKYNEIDAEIKNVKNIIISYTNQIENIDELINQRRNIVEIENIVNNINLNLIDKYNTEINNEKDDLLNTYNDLKYELITVYEQDEELKTEIINMYNKTLETYKNIITQFKLDVDNLYKDTLIPIYNEINEKYINVIDELNNEESNYRKSYNYWKNVIEEFTKKENQNKFKSIVNDIDIYIREFENNKNSFNEFVEKYNEGIITPVNGIVNEFEKNYNNLNKTNISFNTINEAYLIAIDSYNKINELSNTFSQSKYNNIKKTCNNTYISIKTSMTSLYELIVEVNEEALLHKRNIIRFTNAGKILCILYYKFYYGVDDVDKTYSINDGENIISMTFEEHLKYTIYKSLTVEENYQYPLDVFETLCNFSPILPLIWPIGNSSIEANINSTIESKCQYDKTTNTINFSEIYNSIIDLLPQYIENELVEYICNAFINSREYLLDKYIDENILVNFLEITCKNCEDDETFMSKCYELFGIGDEWKLYKYISGKKTPNYNIVVLPNNYPKTNQTSEINEAIIIILNRMFEHYGLLIDKNGNRVKYNENITSDDIIHGGECINFDLSIYSYNRMNHCVFDKYNFILINNANISDGIMKLEPYNKTEEYVITSNKYKKYSNPTKIYNMIFKSGETDLDSLLKPFSITNFIGLESDTIKTIDNLINNLRKYLFGDKGRFRTLINSQKTNLLTSLDYISLKSDDGFKFYSLIYKNIMSNISNWKSIFPITKITSTPYPTSKINNVLNTFDKSYIYSCYYNFKP